MGATQKCKDLAERAFDLTKHYAEPEERELIREFMYVGEWGLGVETIVDMLLEEGIAITEDEKSAILDAANEMGLDRGQERLVVRA